MRRLYTWVGCVVVGLLLSAGVAMAQARERALEQIPELMNRILESQEEIRKREGALKPVVERYNERLDEAQAAIQDSSSETDAAGALVDYVEAYAARLGAQEAALRAIEGSVVRMRADARDLIRAADAAGRESESPRERQAFFKDQFEGIAVATAELADRLERPEEAATAGAVLRASWASHGLLDLPLPEVGPDGAVAFARKVEGLFARYQARTNQLVAERRSVRRLLDVLIERQLAQRLDSLFGGENAVGLGALLSGDSKSQQWQDLGDVVSRTLGLPSGGDYEMSRNRSSRAQLDYFARGEHRQ